MTSLALTLEVDPEVVGVEDLEFANYKNKYAKMTLFKLIGNVLALKSSTCSEGT